MGAMLRLPTQMGWTFLTGGITPHRRGNLIGVRQESICGPWGLAQTLHQAGTQPLLSEIELMTFRYPKVMNHQRKITGVECTVIAVSRKWTFLATKRTGSRRRCLVDAECQTNFTCSTMCVPCGLNFLLFSKHCIDPILVSMRISVMSSCF